MSEQGSGSTSKTPNVAFQSRPKESERTTRRPAMLWDRIRVFFFFSVLFAGLVLVNDAYRHYGAVLNAARYGVRAYWWLVAIACAEIVRQFHYLFEEASPGYYAFWKRRWAGTNRRIGNTNPWLRYR